MPDQFTESDGPITANASGWMMGNGESQMFARIELTEPVERSIEVVTLNSFDIYLKDLSGDRWYFIPENSGRKRGPLEDIFSVPLMALAFAVPPATSMELVQDGYIWKIEDPFPGALMTASYDQGRTLRGLTLVDANGRTLIRASFFDLNEPHNLVPHEKGVLLHDAYWESQ